MGSSSVFDAMRLYVTNDKYYVQPVESEQTLVVDRISRDLTVTKGTADIPSDSVAKSIYGIIGIIRLISGPYLVVVTDRSLVGEINGQLVWMITNTEIYPYSRSLFHLNDQQQQDNRSYENLLKTALAAQGLYYSTTYDLTHTLQRLHNTSSEFSSIPLAERADQRFLWNHNLLRELQQQSVLSQFCMPIMCGYIAVKPVALKGFNFSYILISRRSVFRAGTRYNVRGLDSEGHAANFVETEQIVEFDYTKCSFVQTRGSIPLRWTQKVNLQYKPKVTIADTDNTPVFNNHFNSQVYNYGKQVLVNLVNLSGSEGRLATAMEQIVQQVNNPSIRYVAFDFHKECGTTKWHRLSTLMDRLVADQDQFGYFVTDKMGQSLCQQKGVFRVNCIDCLDRTNVVEGMLAKRSLKQQLVRLGILGQEDQIEAQATFDAVFRNVWADNADFLSIQYAGTAAQKTDFTRFGKRTRLGMIKDFCSGALRYFKNNFYDGFRQDSLDLFLGNYLVEEIEGSVKPCPLRTERDWKFYSLPIVFLVAFSMLTFTVLIPGENWSEQLASAVFWGGASAISAVTIYLYGQDFVDTPKLSTKMKEE